MTNTQNVTELQPRMTREQLIDAARTAAKYLPVASAQLMTELANRLDYTSVALCEAMSQRNALAAENAGLVKFIAQSCYVYNGDGSDISDAYTPAHESPMIPKQPNYLLPVAAECMVLRDAFIRYLASENLSNKPDADERRVYAHCEKWVDAMCETPATDAFLAELRAQGVEMAVDVVKQCYDNICAGGLQENREYEESIVQPHLDGIDDELKEIIAQLRKGVQS